MRRGLASPRWAGSRFFYKSDRSRSGWAWAKEHPHFLEALTASQAEQENAKIWAGLRAKREKEEEELERIRTSLAKKRAGLASSLSRRAKADFERKKLGERTCLECASVHADKLYVGLCPTCVGRREGSICCWKSWRGERCNDEAAGWIHSGGTSRSLWTAMCKPHGLQSDSLFVSYAAPEQSTSGLCEEEFAGRRCGNKAAGFFVSESKEGRLCRTHGEFWNRVLPSYAGGRIWEEDK